MPKRKQLIPVLAALSCALGVLMLSGCSGSSTGSGIVLGPAGKLYVPNQADQTVTIIDSKTLKVIKTFNTPVVEPHFVEFSPDGEFYYIVGRQVGGTVAKYKAANDSLVAQVTVEGVVFPTAFVISPNSDTLYLSDFTLGAGHIHRYDVTGSNFVWIDSILQAGFQTHDLAISPDGRYVISAGFSSDDITIYNTVTGDVTPLTLDSAKQQFTGTVSNNYGAYGVEIDHLGDMAILACRKGVDQIRLIDLNNLTILDSILAPVTNANNPASDGPNYMALSPDNNILFCTNFTENTVTVYRLSTREALKTIEFSTPRAFGIDITDDGSRVYVSCPNVRPAKGMVYVIDGETFEKIDSVEVGSEPFGLDWRPE